mgnify:CR=1 FL=1
MNLTELVLSRLNEELATSEGPRYRVYARIGITSQHHAAWKAGTQRPSAESIEKLMQYFDLVVSSKGAGHDSQA